MKTQIETETQTNQTEKVLLVLSTDTLGIKKDNHIVYLIKGKDTNAYLLECELEPALGLIDVCFDAIDNNYTVTICTQCNKELKFN